MKKNRNGSFSYSGKLSKVLLRMKLTFVLLLCVMSQVFALASAQTVSLKKQNASLEEILWELKEKTQLVFMYSDEDIASVKGIDIDMKNMQVDAILNKCLEGTDLKYVRENNAIVIRRSRQSENVPQVRMRKISGKVTDTNGDPLPGVTILDETDSGLDVDALRIVADGFNKLKTAETSAMVITHYQRLLDYIKPDTVHVLLGGRIVKTGGPELAKEIETRGFDWIRKEAGEL